MTNPPHLLVEYELGEANDAQLVEWACGVLSSEAAISKDPVLVKLAALLPQVPSEIELAGDCFRMLVKRDFPEFTLQSAEGVRRARSTLKRRCQNYIEGRISPVELCSIVSPIEQHFDHPSWLGHLYDACDWVEPVTAREEVPHLDVEAKKAYENL